MPTVEKKLRKGATSQVNAMTPAIAEVVCDTDKHVVVVGDGATAGGFPGARESDILAGTGGGVISPAQITADQNNYNPTGLATARQLRISTDASRSVTGLAGGAAARRLSVHNIGSFNLVLVDESASSTAGNRFALAGSITLTPDQCAVLEYDATTLRWRSLAAPLSGGGSGDVVGPASATDNALARFDGTTGKNIQNSAATVDDAGKLTAVGLVSSADVIFSGVLSPAQITANQNDYAPTNHATTELFRLSTDASRDVTGLAGGTSGRHVTIVNVGSFNLVLKDESASSSAANRFALSADVTIAPDQGAMIRYDATSSRWRVVASPGGGGGGDALTANPLSQFAATTSAQLAGVISDETGSGALVLATSPTLVTPALGTPASGVLTNCTGLPTAGLVDDAVTYAKMQNVSATDRLLGRDTAGAGNVEELTVTGGVEFTGTGIQRSALTGDVTASAGSNSTTIANDAVSNGKLRDSVALSVIGRSAASDGDPGDIVASTNGQALRMAGGTVGFGAIDVADSDAVTGALPIANGGTGQTAQTAAMDALSPTTTKGDLLVDNGTNVVRLPVGADGQSLNSLASDAEGVVWKDPVHSFTIGYQASTALGIGSKTVGLGSTGATDAEFVIPSGKTGKIIQAVGRMKMGATAGSNYDCSVIIRDEAAADTRVVTILDQTNDAVVNCEALGSLASPLLTLTGPKRIRVGWENHTGSTGAWASVVQNAWCTIVIE